MKIEFLIPGSPTEAFYSQAAMFRLGLDSLGGIYARARIALCLGAGQQTDIPARWQPHLDRVDVCWAPVDYFLRDGHPGTYRYEVLDPNCDVSVLCDADTLLVAAFDPGDLLAFVARPAIRGVIAHYPPPLRDAAGRDYSDRGPDDFWTLLAARTLGRDLPAEHHYTLSSAQTPCPFYVNYGFVLGQYELLRRLRAKLAWLLPRIRETLANRFVDQMGLTLGCAAGDIPTEALPIRYNFPNDPVADARYPGELAAVKLIHFLRTDHFDRGRIFTSAAEFESFLELELTGSNLLFQKRVREITAGSYPFS
jgi:hypothetical protein